jgi:hypothetical protein
MDSPFDLAILARSNIIAHPRRHKGNFITCGGGVPRDRSPLVVVNPDRTITDVFAFAGTSSSSSTEISSSTSSNGSFTTSPIPMPAPLPPLRTTRARSITNTLPRDPGKFRVPILQKASSELNVKEVNKSDYWLRVVPSGKVRPRNCDEVPEEFRRAGIGLCFGGKI